MYSKGLNFEFCMLDAANPCSECISPFGGGGLKANLLGFFMGGLKVFLSKK